MTCQVCGGRADFHLTELRGENKFHYHLCSRHKSASDDGSVQPFTDDQEKRMLREQVESSVTDPAALEQMKKAFPDIFDEPRPGDDAS